MAAGLASKAADEEVPNVVLEHTRTDSFESGVRIGDFEIERRLGAGGMGIVYQARQVSLDRRVALKILGPALTQAADLARFQREAQAVARLEHPGIARLYFVGQDAHLCFHVMELIDGVPLRRVLDRLADADSEKTGLDTVVASEMTSDRQTAPEVRFDHPTTDELSSTAASAMKSLSPAAKQVRRSPDYTRRCCEIARDAARALAYAHDQGVIHRDIKPENLMLDQKGAVHIIDFGLARFFDDVSITSTGQLVGTPLYMSPEQVTGRITVDQRTDIYALGMSLYELLTLRRPIEFTSRENLLRNIVTKALPPLCARNPALPRTLEAIVHKATHKDPEERYQTATELGDELDRFLEGKQVIAPAYHYRLNSEEIVASRPGAVVLCAFLCFLAGFTTFAAVVSVGVLTSVMNSMYLMLAVQAGVGLGVLSGTVILALGLLSGRSWAQWVTVVASALIALTIVGAGVQFLISTMRPIPATSGAKASTNREPSPDRSLPPAEKKPPETAPVSQTGNMPNDPSIIGNSSKSTSAPSAKTGSTPAKSTPVDTSRFLIAIMAMYTIPALLAVVCAVTTFVALLLRPTRAWFRMAGQARKEHRQMLKLLQD